MTSRKGYTVAEMMMVVAIIGIVVMIAPTVFTQSIRFYQLHTAKIEIQRDARSCLDTINRFMRQAIHYTVVTDQVTGQPPRSRISFTTVDGQAMSFYQQGNVLYQVGRSTVAVSQNLRFIAFTYPRSDDPTIISVALTMEKLTYQGRYRTLELSIEKVRVMN